jgi:hypothetical protein
MDVLRIRSLVQRGSKRDPDDRAVRRLKASHGLAPRLLARGVQQREASLPQLLSRGLNVAARATYGGVSPSLSICKYFAMRRARVSGRLASLIRQMIE